MPRKGMGNGGMNKPPRTGVNSSDIENSLKGVERRIEAIYSDPARKSGIDGDEEFKALKAEKLRLEQQLEGAKGSASSGSSSKKRQPKPEVEIRRGLESLAEIAPQGPSPEDMAASIETINSLHAFADAARARAAEDTGRTLQEEADAEDLAQRAAHRRPLPPIEEEHDDMPPRRDDAGFHFDTLRDAVEDRGQKDYIIHIPRIDSDATPKESRDTLKSLLEKARTKELRRDIAAPRNNLSVEERRKARAEIKETRKELQAKAEEAQETYLTLLREYHKNKKGHQVFIDGVYDFVEKDFDAPYAVREAKRRWINARAEYAQETSLLIGEYLGDNRNKYDAHAGVELIRKTFIEPQKAAVDARIEGLAARDKNALDKVVSWYKNIPPEVRIPATFALMSIGSTALAAFGGTLSLAPLVVSGGLVAAQTALHFAASRMKDPGTKARLSKIASALTLGGLAGMLTSAGIKGLDSKLGLVKEAKTTLADMTDFKEARAFEKQHEKVRLHKENVERVAGLAGAAASIGIGSMFGHWLRGLGAGHEHVDTSGHGDTAHKGWSFFGKNHTAPAESGHEASSQTGTEAAASQSSSTPEAPAAPPAPSVEAYTATVRPGQGVESLLNDMRAHYEKIYPDHTQAPEHIRALLDAPSAHEIARTQMFTVDGEKYPFIDADGKSVVIGSHASFSIDEQGNLHFDPDTKVFEFRAPHEHVASTHHETPAEHTASVAESTSPEHAVLEPQEDPSDALNRAQVAEYQQERAVAAPEALQGSEQMVPSVETPNTPAAQDAPTFVRLPNTGAEGTPVDTSSPVVHEGSAPEAPAVTLNAHEVPVDPTVPHRYELPNHKMVVWGGDDFQEQLDFANKFIQEQRALGNEATVYVPRTFPGDSAPSLIELNTQGGDTMYRPDELPFPPFGKDDFIKLIK